MWYYIIQTGDTENGFRTPSGDCARPNLRGSNLPRKRGNKMKRYIPALLAALICTGAVSCAFRTGAVSDTAAATEAEPYSSGTETAEEEKNTADTVSALAVGDFMLPLDEFSWEREFPAEIVMLHFTSAVVKNPADPYNTEEIRSIFAESGVSINYIIERDGTVRCFIPENRAAWHAGRGEWGDAKYTNAMNKYSIGIEIEAIGSQNDMLRYMTAEEYAALDRTLIGFTDAQYTALSALLDDICMRNSIPKNRSHVIGHDEYNPAKNDPGELFDWSRIGISG